MWSVTKKISYVLHVMLDRYSWIRHIAITAHYIAHDDKCVSLLKEGLITESDAQEIIAYIRDTLAPAGPGHAAAESINVISIERVPEQLELFP